MTRNEATERILAAKREKQLTFTDIARAVGRHPVWVTSALLGQATMSADEAQKAVSAVGLGLDIAASLQEAPTRGSVGQPVDPTIYRLYEVAQVYGTTISALIREMFGDGIMSAVDFEMDIKKRESSKGDRVVITLDGKFLPYHKW
jgi:cyanate lyase